MRRSNCRAYQRHDHTATTKQLKLSARHWAIIEDKQEALAEALGVRRVSKPVALRHILEETVKRGSCVPEGAYCYDPEAFDAMETPPSEIGEQA